MLSNRTAKFKEKSEVEDIKLNNTNIFKKVATTPLKKFDMNFKFGNEEKNQSSSFSFKDDLLDKKSYDFIKSKDECLTFMELDDQIPKRIEESDLE